MFVMSETEAGILFMESLLLLPGPWIVDATLRPLLSMAMPGRIVFFTRRQSLFAVGAHVKGD